MKFSDADDKEQIKLCPKCEFAQVLEIEATKLECPECNCVVCPECGMEPHEGLSCSESLMKKNGLQDVHNMMKAQGLKYCPSCNGIVFKQSGCNFVYCGSSKCKSTRMLCNWCGLKIYERDHHSHFLYSPCGLYCKVKC